MDVQKNRTTNIIKRAPISLVWFFLIYSLPVYFTWASLRYLSLLHTKTYVRVKRTKYIAIKTNFVSICFVNETFPIITKLVEKYRNF